MIRFLFLMVYVLPLAACSISESSNHGKQAGADPEPGLELQIPRLDEMVPENSALLLFRNKIWTINDHGGEAVLFALDMQTGKAIQAIYIKDAENRDWEELTQDPEIRHPGSRKCYC